MTRLKAWFKKRWDWLKKNWDYTIAPIVVVVSVVANNWNRGWFNDLEGIDIVLIVAILLFFMGYLYILLRIIPTLEFVGGRVGKNKIRVFGTLLGSLVIFYLLWNLHGILPNKWVEISLLAGLVAVTSGLAVYAAAQAYASVKMAEATFKPIIAIDWIGPWPDTKEDTSAVFKNIGVGPALNLKCYFTHPKFNFQYKDDAYTVMGVEEKHTISLRHENFDKEQAGLAINCDYQNVSGKNFRSILRFEAEGKKHFEILETKGEKND